MIPVCQTTFPGRTFSAFLSRFACFFSFGDFAAAVLVLLLPLSLAATVGLVPRRGRTANASVLPAGVDRAQR